LTVGQSTADLERLINSVVAVSAGSGYTLPSTTDQVKADGA